MLYTSRKKHSCTNFHPRHSIQQGQDFLTFLQFHEDLEERSVEGAPQKVEGNSNKVKFKGSQSEKEI